MLTIADLTARFPRAGRVQSILLRPRRHMGPSCVRDAYLAETGLEGDHARAGKRALTLLQAEHLPVIAALSGAPMVEAASLRRNLVISDLNLSACRGRTLLIGGFATVTITGPCAPCSRMEAALGPGGYNAMRGHGGWCAQVVLSGQIACGDTVTVLPRTSD